MRRLPVFLLGVILALFAAGLWHTFKLRFESGDVYPAYSSFRADPLGTMAFFETLERTAGLTVRRDMDSRGQLPEGGDTVYLHLAASPWQWARLPERDFKQAEDFLVAGGRLVIAFYPETGELEHWGSSSVDTNKNDTGRAAKAKKKPARKDDGEEHEAWVSLAQRWGIGLAALPLQLQEDEETYEPAQVRLQAEADLPASLPWHSSLILTNAGTAWKTIYTRGRHPVLAQRNFGKGQLVIATDSYFLSNQALRSERQTQLLSWILGSGTRIYFDEEHLGITETPGIGGLIRKYRLHWLGLGLLALAGLYIWKNASALAFPAVHETGPDHVAGRQAATGFINLLRRNLPARELLATCFAEWERSAPRQNPHLAARAARAREHVAGGLNEANAVQAYRDISGILHPPHKP